MCIFRLKWVYFHVSYIELLQSAEMEDFDSMFLYTNLRGIIILQMVETIGKVKLTQ